MMDRRRRLHSNNGRKKTMTGSVRPKRVTIPGISVTIWLMLLVSTTSFAEVKLPRLVGDGMVLQRDVPVRLWGWASVNEKITVQFRGSTYAATADSNGNWDVMLPQLKAGGPDDMRIEASNSITIHDIVVGDVWVCSGQSNMGLALGWLASVYQDEIDHSENPNIRQFLVPPGTRFDGRDRDYRFGAWQHATPKNVRSFTAVGYFFAKYLYEKYKVPIGLIHASLGGSSTEAWISKEAIKAFPKYFEDAQRFGEPGLLDRPNKQDDERVGTWNRLVRQNDEGYKDTLGLWSDPKNEHGGLGHHASPGILA